MQKQYAAFFLSKHSVIPSLIYTVAISVRHLLSHKVPQVLTVPYESLPKNRGIGEP